MKAAVIISLEDVNVQRDLSLLEKGTHSCFIFN